MQQTVPKQVFIAAIAVVVLIVLWIGWSLFGPNSPSARDAAMIKARVARAQKLKGQ
ncbi:MAG TPA: hypothetical protein VKT32_02590 [Chthonomonadaceae bacterium]|nr:hypothetical protein [Chthonomonadaceae bacterium]